MNDRECPVCGEPAGWHHYSAEASCGLCDFSWQRGLSYQTLDEAVDAYIATLPKAVAAAEQALRIWKRVLQAHAAAKRSER